MRPDVPAVPILGVGGVIVRDGRAVIARRAHDPAKGQWTIPGGRVELGESLADAVRREMREETGLDVRVGAILEVFERIDRDDGGVRFHFVVVDYLCAPAGGELRAGDDADAVAWVAGDELAAYGVSDVAAAIIRKALELAIESPP